ncbi:biotin--[acetyl-CoA-carboxylase] ligase [Methylobacillus flagellatus]|uniref:biotin--[acetyl-CoA-carboxylase] ligase n=1 Tax=Methylobacillus flagellatus TaxID=405 RepID=UPI0010F80F04|nr:biotin--[acetyl-CoA-carboxylase] ligase [Methylobacillus flagellatus]
MNQLTFPILRLLADGRFHSGEAIARHFGVTRATVWNALQEAEALGVTLYSVRGRGYRLPEAVKLLDREAVLAAIGVTPVRFNVELHDRIDSTNSYLMQQAAAGAPQASCVAATLQTGGRGRRGRVWQAGLGASLTFSLLWRFQSGAQALSGLSLAVGVAMVRALHAYGVQAVKLKWPNDLLLEQGGHYHKLSGILIELQGDMEGPSAAVIGIGLNLRLPEELRRQIDQPAAALQDARDEAIDPNELLGLLLRELGEVLLSFEQHGFEPLREQWQRQHAYQHKAVRMLMPDSREVHGTVRGVAPDGVLLVETVEGIQRFSSGEISLRGID